MFDVNLYGNTITSGDIMAANNMVKPDYDAKLAWYDGKIITFRELFKSPEIVLDGYKNFVEYETRGKFFDTRYDIIAKDYGLWLANKYREKTNGNIGKKLHLYCYPVKARKTINNKFRDTACLNDEFALITTYKTDNEKNNSISCSQRLAVIRGYYSKSGSMAYAMLWINGNMQLIGNGKAGGAGYDRLHSALLNALESVGYCPCAYTGNFIELVDTIFYWVISKQRDLYNYIVNHANP